MAMSKWNLRFIELAELVGSWSKENSSKVGAVIVDKKNRIISVGFNGFASGVKDTYNSITYPGKTITGGSYDSEDLKLLSLSEADRDEKLRRVIHAEENAILFAQRDLTGTTIYVTHPPCARCSSKIIQSGIISVYCNQPTDQFRERWKDDIKSSSIMFGEAGINFYYNK